jgi:hypothetical protein
MKTSPMTPPSEQLRDGDLWLSLPEMDDVEAVVQHAKHPDMDETYWLPGKASRHEAGGRGSNR